MSRKFTEDDYVPALDPDWHEALRYSTLDGLAGLVLNEQFVVVDATEETAKAIGWPLRDLIGARLEDLPSNDPFEPRRKRLQRVFDN